jgi:hypothetical protein
MNRFEAQRSGDYEFEAFDGAEYEGANFGKTGFGEAEFGEAEFGEAEFGGAFEGEWEGEARVRDHRRPTASRAGYRPTAWSSRSRSYTPRPARWGTRTSYRSRPVSRSWSRPWSRPSYRPAGYRWGQPGLSSQWYRGGQYYPGRYWRFGQGQTFAGGTPQWGTWDRFGRRRRRYPYYSRYGTGGSAYAQPSYDEPVEPPYEEPPMPPPVIVAAPPPPPPQAPMPPPETPPADPNATTMPPPAQDQAKAGEFFIEPEAFEFEPELDIMFEEGGYEAEASGPSSSDLLRAIPDNPDSARFIPLDYRLDAKAIVGKLSSDLEQLKDPSAKDIGKFAKDVFKFVGGGSPVSVMLNILGGALKNIPGGYLGAAAEIADDWAKSGFARGVAVGAGRRSQKYLIETFSHDYIPKNHFFPHGRTIAAANYGAGLVAGYIQGKALTKNQHAIFWGDIRRRMGDRAHHGDRSAWTTQNWRNWYVDVGSAFRGYHL